MQVGDIILSNDSGFLPRAIRFFMKRYAKRLGVKVDTYYNHAAICVEIGGELRVAEAMAKGVQIIKTPEEYLKKHPKHLIRTWVKPLDNDEKKLISAIVRDLSLRITKYDFKNFTDQIGLIEFNQWNGKMHVEALARIYCSELCAYAMDCVRDTFGGVWWLRNPLALQINNQLKDI